MMEILRPSRSFRGLHAYGAKSEIPDSVRYDFLKRAFANVAYQCAEHHERQGAVNALEVEKKCTAPRYLMANVPRSLRELRRRIPRWVGAQMTDKPRPARCS